MTETVVQARRRAAADLAVGIPEEATVTVMHQVQVQVADWAVNKWTSMALMVLRDIVV